VPDSRPESGRSPVVYYIRHGQTDWNAERRFQGQRDIPLNETGIEQARGNGRRLARVISDPAKFDFLCSPMIRSRLTMELVRAELGADPAGYNVDERLAEASYGDWEGIAEQDIIRDHPDLWARREADRWTFLPPNGESLAMVIERIRPVFDGITRDTVIVAHGAVGRAVRRYMLGLNADAAAFYEFPQDRIFRFADGEEELL
jgi:probable phosphoglycerate mutase